MAEAAAAAVGSCCWAPPDIFADVLICMGVLDDEGVDEARYGYNGYDLVRRDFSSQRIHSKRI